VGQGQNRQTHRPQTTTTLLPTRRVLLLRLLLLLLLLRLLRWMTPGLGVNVGGGRKPEAPAAAVATAAPPLPILGCRPVHPHTEADDAAARTKSTRRRRRRRGGRGGSWARGAFPCPRRRGGRGGGAAAACREAAAAGAGAMGGFEVVEGSIMMSECCQSCLSGGIERNETVE
jgi:hypothetical protein